MGPTGAGKSELAVGIARAHQGEVVNCDSLQFYRGMDIGTAKMPPAERQGVPHHLLDFLAPEEVFTAGEYARQASRVMNEIAARGNLPILCGGSGFYLKALLDGLFDAPVRDEAQRAVLASREERRPGFLHRYLRRIDPTSAARIHARDVNKLIRAIEVCRQEGRAMSDLHQERPRVSLTGFRVLKVGLNPPRAALYEKIDRRTRAMFDGGLLEEVRQLLANGAPENAKAFEAVGYRQALDLVNGRVDFEQAVSDTAQRTRNYAKRQWTWFRRDPEVVWLDGFGGEDAVLATALQHVRQFVAAG